MGIKPWQVQQAPDAVRIYRYRYRDDDGDGDCSAFTILLSYVFTAQR
ncbi:MAG: hypothetical protein U9Q23_05730 [Candidatus Bipolaricaulota bacterium]|nr:hypothetical protein [Candidatus Bipolaricaulota bacterium]